MISDFYKKIAEELEIDPELVKFVDDHIFETLQKHMADPEKWTFLINKFVAFEPKFFRVKKTIENINLKPELTPALEARLKQYERLLKMGEEHMKQQKIDGKKRNDKHQE